MEKTLNFCVFIISLSGLCYGLDFYDCGNVDTTSQALEIADVLVEGCSQIPCVVHRNQPNHVSVIPELVNPEIDSADLDVSAFLVGATFILDDVSYDRPCIVDSCPLKTPLVQPHFNFTFTIDENMFAVQSLITASVTFYNINAVKSHFCVKFLIDVY